MAVAVTVAAPTIVVRLAGCCSVLLVCLRSGACNTITCRRNGFFFARCSHFNDKTESKDGQESGEMSHTRSFSISKLLRLIDPKRCNISRKCFWAAPSGQILQASEVRLAIWLVGSWSVSVWLLCLLSGSRIFWAPGNIINLRSAYCIILLGAPFWF